MLEATERLLAARVPEAEASARALLAELLGCGRAEVLLRRQAALGAEDAERYRVWIDRRARREPVEHITGTVEFRGLTLSADRRALIPRPETEELVEACLSLELPQDARVLDVGTGSGCIAIALAVERRAWRVVALDRSHDALDLARTNVRAHGLEDRLTLEHGDLAALPADWTGRFDLVVSNPPYVAERDWEQLEPEVRDHDPREALVAGPTGLEAYAALAPVARRVLRQGGRLALELGFGQAGEVGRIVASAGFGELALRRDVCDVERILLAR